MELLGDTVSSVVVGWCRTSFWTNRNDPKPQPQSKQLTMRNLVALAVQMVSSLYLTQTCN